MSEPYVVARDLTKRYGEQPPSVDRANFSLEKGEMLALLGPSGCGKTTILRMIAGLIEPTSGSIRIDGREIAALPVHRRNMGMVFQSYALLPHLTVADNVGFGLEMRGVGKAERMKRVDAALQMVKLGGLGERRISQLSGGQQQRAAIARSLVIEPSLLLLDEPLSNLDAKLRDELRNEIRDLQRRTGTTAIFVTHDQSEALAAADRIVVMSAGRIEQTGSPSDIFDRPATRFVASFIGDGTFLEGEADGDTVQIEGVGAVKIATAMKGKTILMLRPHRVDFVGDGAVFENEVEGTVESAVYTGELVSSSVRVGPHLIAVNRLARGRDIAPGEKVTLGWRAEDAIIIPGDAR
ncbi:ABC transporter ATP-binding protein [Terrarubrum flagellatum]|uniref:ABC transporter ATP-binding protein n=1 Tax=Terrirubrum flagellatum TaxID=2895980 RepID=UPI0031450CAB